MIKKHVYLRCPRSRDVLGRTGLKVASANVNAYYAEEFEIVAAAAVCGNGNSKNAENVATDRWKNRVIAVAGNKRVAWLNWLAVGT